jgi:translation initiation factor 2 subunit 2
MEFNEINVIKLDSIDSFKIINPNVEINIDPNISPNLNDSTNSDLNSDVNSHINLIENVENINLNMNPDKIYTLILDEIYETISDNNQLFGNANTNISKPDIKYENRKTFWYNYGKNCTQLNRTTQQLKIFFEKELAVESSINDKSQLILRGKYNFNLIASTFKKYIKNYVQCSTCKSIQTEIARNSSNRLDYLKCLNPKCNTCKVVVKM